MDTTNEAGSAHRLRQAFGAELSSERLQAALTAGTYPEPEYLEVLVEQCRSEPDFYVRDMLTWSLTRQPPTVTVQRLLIETESELAQARSQALHTLSKIGDPRGWAAISPALLQDPDDNVARSAWRAAVILVPEGGEAVLAETLSTQLGRGGREVQVSLGQAFAALGDAALPVLEELAHHSDPEIRILALAAERLVNDPEEGFESAMYEARRVTGHSGDA